MAALPFVPNAVEVLALFFLKKKDLGQIEEGAICLVKEKYATAAVLIVWAVYVE